MRSGAYIASHEDGCVALSPGHFRQIEGLCAASALCNSAAPRAAQPLRDTLSRLNASAVNHKCAAADMNVAYFCLRTHFLIPAGEMGML